MARHDDCYRCQWYLRDKETCEARQVCPHQSTIDMNISPKGLCFAGVFSIAIGLLITLIIKVAIVTWKPWG